MAILDNTPIAISTTSPTTTKLIYEKPVLEIISDVRSITLGGSPGLGESGGARKKKAP
jgi:hypothetical protein